MSNSTELKELKELAQIISRADRTRVRRGDSGRRQPRAETVAESSDDSGIKDGRMWAVYGGRNYSACETAVNELPPGQYTVDVNNHIGIFFRREDINLDELMILPDSRSSEVIAEIQKFWTLEEKFREFGYLWKRGVMLWGPPGSGKTSTLQIISKNIVDANGISVYVTDPDLASKALKSLRQVEAKRPIVIMLEDIDAIIDEHGESELLALMDGELQIDNVVFVATTNYPDRLDPRFVNRPSRFDIVKKIGMPSAAARKAYIVAKNKRLATEDATTELTKWVSETKDFSIAHIKELIISVEVFGQDRSTAVQRLRQMAEKPDPTKRDGTTFGFAARDNDED